RRSARGGVSIDILREGQDTVEALQAAVLAGQPANEGDDPANEVRVLNAGFGDVPRSTSRGATGLEPQEPAEERRAPEVRVVTETSVPDPIPAANQPRVERRVQAVERLNRGTSRNPNVERPLNFPTVNYEAPRNPNAYF
ncbi:MAG: hypothetical protein ACJA1R_000790, partial [Flavobacteriales bacterium]